MDEIRRLINKHYGAPMRVLVQTREEDIHAYEMAHTEVPSTLWEWVDHNTRLLREWCGSECCVDLVVWDGTYRLVQDICFKDAYRSPDEWWRAIGELIKSNRRIWVVRHLD